MEERFELGPVQLAWIKRLKEHPELQGKGHLGSISDGIMEYCCLGMGICVLNQINGVDDIIIANRLREGNDSHEQNYLYSRYKELGLWDYKGSGLGDVSLQIGEQRHQSLADANDWGVSWLDIAEFIENNPEQIFTHSV